MNEKEIAEINKYCDPYSILIVTYKRKLVRLQCPFTVEFLIDINGYKKGDVLFVTSVKIDRNLQLIYTIQNKNISYNWVKILFAGD